MFASSLKTVGVFIYLFIFLSKHLHHISEIELQM